MDSPPDDDRACPSCGEHVRQRANFCQHCGEQLDTGQSATAHDLRDSTEERATSQTDGWDTETRRTGESGHTRERPTSGTDTHTRRGSDRREKRSQRDERRHRTSRDRTAHADLPQWRAFLPAQVRPGEQSGLRVSLGALGLVAVSLIVATVLSLVGGLIGGLFGLAVTQSLESDAVFTAALIGAVIGNFAGFAVLGLSYLRWRGFDRGRIVSYLGITRPTAKQLGLVVGTALLMVVAAGVLTQVVLQLLELAGIEASPAENSSTQILEENPSPALLVGGIAFMFLVVGPTEELLFRGVIQGRLRERLSAPTAIVIASVLFGSVHLLALSGGGPAGIATTLAVLSTVAIALGSIYEYTGNLVVAALTHGLYNSILITGLYITTTTDIESSGAVVLQPLVALL
jgi:membrane protease YdiL (CAAX protease family)